VLCDVLLQADELTPGSEHPGAQECGFVR